MAEVQIGAWLEILVVENLDDETEENEIVVDYTTDDVDVDRNPEEISWVEHGNPNEQRREGHESTTSSFAMLVTDDGQNLADANMLDSESGRILRNVRHEALRLKWYNNEIEMEEGNYSQSWTGEDAQFVFQSMNAPIDDVTTIETSVWIHGATRFDGAAEE